MMMASAKMGSQQNAQRPKTSGDDDPSREMDSEVGGGFVSDGSNTSDSEPASLMAATHPGNSSPPAQLAGHRGISAGHDRARSAKDSSHRDVHGNSSAAYAEIRALEQALRASLEDNLDAVQAQENLQRALSSWNLVEEPVPGDNNCLFHALVLQLERLGRFSGSARDLRRRIVDWMARNSHLEICVSHAGGPTSLRDFVEGSWETYLAAMGQHNGAWGDHCVLIAAGESRKALPLDRTNAYRALLP